MICAVLYYFVHVFVLILHEFRLSGVIVNHRLHVCTH